MKISLATNFDNSLVEQIEKYGVYELYGRLPYDVLSGGRPNNAIKIISKNDFEDHVRKVREKGINFNYLFNGSCTENQEQDEIWKEKFRDYILYLKEVGVNAFTVTNPIILKLIKKIYPKAICRVSTFACVNTIGKMKYWESLGADIICADFTTINRDFKLLKNIVEELKTAKIELLATNSCLKDCPLIHTHVNSISHASSMASKNNYVDWCLYKCQYRELCDVEEYVKSPWIRPEDIKYYEEIGIEHFKITERDFPTEILVKRLDAYCNRKYDGNLLDLIQGHGYELANNKKLELVKKPVFLKEDIINEINRVRGFKQERQFPCHVYIDNKKFGNFIDFFVQGKCCGNCSECGYCLAVANNVISIDHEIMDYLKELYERLDKIMMEI